MGIVGIETIKQVLGDVSSAITISVFQQHQEWFLRQIDTLRGQFEADRHVEAIGKDRLAVSSAVTISVFVDQDLVVRLGVARLVMRIAGQGRHPEPSTIVKPHLAGIAEIGKLLLRSKQRNVVALWQRELLQQFHFFLQIGGAAILRADRIVRFNS